MSNLRFQLDQIASQFASSVLAVLRDASLADIVGPAGSRNGALAGSQTRAARSGAIGSPNHTPGLKGRRRKRASSEDVQQLKNTALSAAKQLKPGFSKGDVMKKARSTVNLGRALALLVADGELTRKGDRRNTRYWVR